MRSSTSPVGRLSLRVSSERRSIRPVTQITVSRRSAATSSKPGAPDSITHCVRP